MDNENETKVQETAETAGAEGNEAATALGKFQSVDALLNAYLSLEAEFTRRSQRLKELEDENKTLSASSPESQNNGEVDEDAKNAIIEDYLKSVSSSKGVPLIVGGLNAAAPRQTPKTIKEAGELAARFLKK